MHNPKKPKINQKKKMSQNPEKIPPSLNTSNTFQILSKSAQQVTKALTEHLEAAEDKDFSSLELKGCTLDSTIRMLSSSLNDPTSLYNFYSAVRILDCSFSSNFRFLGTLESSSLLSLTIQSCNLPKNPFSYLNLPLLTFLDLSRNGLPSVRFLVESKLPALQTLDLSDNQLDLDSQGLSSFFDSITPQLPELTSLSLSRNNFKGFDYFNYSISRMGFKLATLDGYEITKQMLETAQKRVKERSAARRQRRRTTTTNIDWESSNQIKFGSLTEKVKTCLRDPSLSIQALKSLNDKVEQLVKVSAVPTAPPAFLESHDQLGDEIRRFIIEMKKLLETQRSTTSLVLRILVIMTMLRKECCLACFRVIKDYMRSHKKVLIGQIKSILMPTLKNPSLEEISGQGHSVLMLELSKLIEDLELYELIDYQMMECVNSWMVEVSASNFQHESIFGDKIAEAAISISKSVLASVEPTLPASQVVKDPSSYKGEISFLKFFLEEHLLINFSKIRNCRTNLEPGYYTWLIFVVQAVSCVCTKRSFRPGFENLASEVYLSKRFLGELVEQLDSLVSDLFLSEDGNTTSSSSDSLHSPKLELFSSIFVAIDTILAPDIQEQIDLTSELFTCGSRSPDGIFMTIFRLAFGEASRSSIKYQARTAIYNFAASCLENESITFSGSHYQFVKELTKIMNNCKDLLTVLDQALGFESRQEMAYVISVCKILKYYCYNAVKENALTPQNQEGTNNSLVQAEDIFSICFRVSMQLDKLERDRKLFACLEIDHDGLRLAIVDILNALPIDQYNPEDIKTLWSKVVKQTNFGNGSIELILGTIFFILTKIIENPLGENFVKFMGLECLNVTLGILDKTMSRDLRDDPEEQHEKDQLAVCAVLFLKYLMKSDPMYNMLEPASLLEGTLSILENEALLNNPSAADCDLERAVSADNAKHLVEFLKKLDSTNFSFFRVLNHLANLLEGKQYRYLIDNFSSKWLIKDVLVSVHAERMLMIDDELGIFLQEEEGQEGDMEDAPLEEGQLPSAQAEGHSEQGSQGSEETPVDKTKFYNWINSEIMAVVHSEKLLGYLLNKIYEYQVGLNQDNTSKPSNRTGKSLTDLYRVKKKKLFERKARIVGQNSGQSFLMSRLRSRKRDNVQNDGLNRRARMAEMLRGLPPPTPISDLFKYQLSPLTHEKASQQVQSMDPDQPFLDVNQASRPLLSEKLFTLNVCAFLRIIYNMLIQNPRDDFEQGYQNETNNLEFLGDRSNLEKLMYICEGAGWGTGYIASKFLRIISESLNDDRVLARGQRANKDPHLSNSSFSSKSSDSSDQNTGLCHSFEQNIEIYRLRFSALCKIINFFQHKFASTCYQSFSSDELEVIEDTSRNCYQTMKQVKDLILDEYKESPAYIKRSQIYDIHLDSENSPEKELTRWVLTRFVPERFVKIFVEALVKMYRPTADGDSYNYQNTDLFRRTMHTSLCISEFMSLYISIFPEKRFELVSYFLQMEVQEGFKIRPQVLASIVENAFFFSKTDHIAEFMSKEQAGEGRLPAGESVRVAMQAFWLRPGVESGEPVLIVLSNRSMYVFKESQKERCTLCRPDSLCPEPPVWLMTVHMPSIGRREEMGMEGGRGAEVQDECGDEDFEELPDSCTMAVKVDEGSKGYEYFDLKSNDGLIFFQQTLVSLFELEMVRDVEDSKDFFGKNHIAISSVVLIDQEEDEGDISFKKLYQKRGKKVILLTETSLELLDQDLTRYPEVSAHIKQQDVRLNSEQIFDMMYHPAQKPLLYEDITDIYFSLSEGARVTITAENEYPTRKLDMVFPSDQEREKFKWSISHKKIEQYCSFSKNLESLT